MAPRPGAIPMEASSPSGIISPTAFLRSRFLISSGPVDRGGAKHFQHQALLQDRQSCRDLERLCKPIDGTLDYIIAPPPDKRPSPDRRAPAGSRRIEP